MQIVYPHDRAEKTLHFLHSHMTMIHLGPHNSAHMATCRRHHPSFPYRECESFSCATFAVRPELFVLLRARRSFPFPPSTFCTTVHIRTARTGSIVDTTLAAYNLLRGGRFLRRATQLR